MRGKWGRRGLFLLLGVGIWLRAGACDNTTIRDAAFGQERDMHYLCVVGNSSDTQAAAIFDDLKQWLDSEGGGLNIELKRLSTDEPAVSWESYGMPSEPSSVPVVVLVGKALSQQRAFVIDHWEPAPTADDLEILRTSPARESLKAGLARSWAAMLYSPGDSPGESNTESVLNSVIRGWNKEQPSGLSVVRLNRTDPAERALRGFIGLEISAPDWVGIVYGRGKLMAPPLVASEISEENLTRLLTTLRGTCSCIQQAAPSGLDIPMTWDAGLDTQALALRAIPDPSDGVAGKNPAMVAVEAELDDVVRGNESRMIMTILVLLALIALAIGGGTSLIIWRRRRQRRVLPGSQ